ncbi:hypothetical protein LOK49_LG12G01338 [Camellia lanceoleosa]|uniref:Uncharacterized protein n=1 Tax=Camellia lanceoleosa TaxID=1840588 RepID=A0ACC0FSA7_9ERIC|nr:hypothetical protein LOK49_LG12G01338 [Camellia lanceoleosa]
MLLSVGHGEFHGEVMHTLKFVVNQSDYTVHTLRNVTEYLLLAKTINMVQKTIENSETIQRVFNTVRSALIIIAVLMLLLSLIGLVLSILGHKHAIQM